MWKKLLTNDAGPAVSVKKTNYPLETCPIVKILALPSSILEETVASYSWKQTRTRSATAGPIFGVESFCTRTCCVLFVLVPPMYDVLVHPMYRFSNIVHTESFRPQLLGSLYTRT